MNLLLFTRFLRYSSSFPERPQSLLEVGYARRHPFHELTRLIFLAFFVSSSARNTLRASPCFLSREKVTSRVARLEHLLLAPCSLLINLPFYQQKASMKMERSPRESKNGQSPSSLEETDKCRSLVCDSSGIIIAEMVYRCMICYYVTDSITEAKAHYQSDHMNDDEEEDEETESPAQTNQALSSNRSFNNINHNNNNHRNSFKNNNPLVPDVNLYEESSPINFKFNSSNNNNHLSKCLA